MKLTWPNELDKKEKEKHQPYPHEQREKKNRPWTVLTWKHQPDHHEREQQERPFPCAGSPSTRLPCPRNPFGTCPGTWWTNRNQSSIFFVAICFFLLRPLCPVGHLAGTGALHRTTDPPKWKCVLRWDIVGYDDEHSKMKCFEERNKILPSASKLESKWKMREGVSRIVAVNSWVKVNESLGFPKQNTARIAIAVQCYSVLLQRYNYCLLIWGSQFPIKIANWFPGLLVFKAQSLVIQVIYFVF